MYIDDEKAIEYPVIALLPIRVLIRSISETSSFLQRIFFFFW